MPQNYLPKNHGKTAPAQQTPIENTATNNNRKQMQSENTIAISASQMRDTSVTPTRKSFGVNWANSELNETKPKPGRRRNRVQKRRKSSHSAYRRLRRGPDRRRGDGVDQRSLWWWPFVGLLVELMMYGLWPPLHWW